MKPKSTPRIRRSPSFINFRRMKRSEEERRAMPTSPIEALSASEKNAKEMLERNPNNLLMLAQLGYIRKDLANVYFQEGRRTKANDSLVCAEDCFKYD